MKTAWVSLYLITIAALMIACTPSSKLPITGEIKLAFVGKDTSGIHFKLQNQTSKNIAFVGVRDWWWEGVFPQGPVFECISADGTHESPYPLIDGPDWKEFVIKPGQEIDLVVSSFYLAGVGRGLPSRRCKLVLWLKGRVAVESDEFEPITSAS